MIDGSPVKRVAHYNLEEGITYYELCYSFSNDLLWEAAPRGEKFSSQIKKSPRDAPPTTRPTDPSETPDTRLYPTVCRQVR